MRVDGAVELVVDPRRWELTQFQMTCARGWQGPSPVFVREVEALAVAFLRERPELQRADAALAVDTFCTWLSDAGGWHAGDSTRGAVLFWDYLWEGGWMRGYEPSTMADAIVRFMGFVRGKGRLDAKVAERLARELLREGMTFVAVANGLLPLEQVRSHAARAV